MALHTILSLSLLMSATQSVRTHAFVVLSIYTIARLYTNALLLCLVFVFFPQNHSVARAEFGHPCIPYENTGPNKTGFWSGFQPISAASENVNGFWSNSGYFTLTRTLGS
jgi:hypothetical protein